MTKNKFYAFNGTEKNKTDPESYASGLCLELGINFSFIYFFKTLRATNLLQIYGSTTPLETLSFIKQSDFKNKRF